MGSGKRNYKAMRTLFRKKPKKGKETIQIEEDKPKVDPEEYIKNLLKKDGNNTQDN